MTQEYADELETVRKHFKKQEQFAKFALELLREKRTAAVEKDRLSDFLWFALPLLPISQSQIFQDLWVLWELDRRESGYYVEFGAADGIKRSNTYLLERDFGWNGILAEPNPAYWNILKTNRSGHISNACVYSRSGERIPFLSAKFGELSRIKEICPDDGHEKEGRRAGANVEEVLVDTISLDDLLRSAAAPKRIDYLSVDTEGSEYEVIKDFDFSRWDIRTISVEHNYSAMRVKIHDVLCTQGYKRKWPEFSRFDDWYVKIS